MTSDSATGRAKERAQAGVDPLRVAEMIEGLRPPAGRQARGGEPKKSKKYHKSASLKKFLGRCAAVEIRAKIRFGRCAAVKRHPGVLIIER